LLNILINHDDIKLSKSSIKIITGHYINVTHRRVAHGWKKFQR